MKSKILSHFNNIISVQEWEKSKKISIKDYIKQKIILKKKKIKFKNHERTKRNKKQGNKRRAESHVSKSELLNNISVRQTVRETHGHAAWGVAIVYCVRDLAKDTKDRIPPLARLRDTGIKYAHGGVCVCVSQVSLHCYTGRCARKLKRTTTTCNKSHKTRRFSLRLSLSVCLYRSSSDGH
jgi:hypothetical protein